MAIFNSYVKLPEGTICGDPQKLRQLFMHEHCEHMFVFPDVASQAGADIQFQELPAWDAFDRHVLRFTGYFKAGYWVLGILKGWVSTRDSTSNDKP